MKNSESSFECFALVFVFNFILSAKSKNYLELIFILNAFIIFSDLVFCCMISVSPFLMLLFGYCEKSLEKKWKIA